jgi:hypothetical protein
VAATPPAIDSPRKDVDQPHKRKDRKDLPAMGNKEPASVIRVRALNKLKTALKRAGHTSTIESSGTSRILLHVLSLGIDVDCRTNPSDDHTWWYWLDNEPISPTEDPSTTIETIKRRHTTEATA